MNEMLKNLILSMMPPGFDMSAFLDRIGVTMNRVLKMCDTADDSAAKIEFLGKQLQAVMGRLEPENREVDGWMVKSYKSGAVHYSDVDPRSMITQEDIANDELVITPLYK